MNFHIYIHFQQKGLFVCFPSITGVRAYFSGVGGGGEGGVSLGKRTECSVVNMFNAGIP